MFYSNQHRKVVPSITINITSSFEMFEAEAPAAGFDAALVRDGVPGKLLDEYAHPFDADAVITRGEMGLSYDGSTRRLLPGDIFITVAASRTPWR